MNWIEPTSTSTQAAEDWISLSAEILSLGFFSRSITFSDSLSFGKSIAQAEKSARGFSDYLTRVQDLITRMVRTLAETFGCEISLGFDRNARAIKSLTQRVILLKSDPCMFNGCNTELFVRSVINLEKDIFAYLGKISSTKENTPYILALRNTLSLMNPLLIQVKNDRFTRASRFVPLTTNFVGGSGVGKTQLSEVYACQMFIRNAPPGEIERVKDLGINGFMFVPDMSGKHYDTYNRQYVWLINDFLQKMEMAGASQSEIVLFIQMIGNSPLPLPCAELGLKGLVMFVSELVVTSMNMLRVTEAQIKVLTHLGALVRRLNEHLNFLVYVKPEFRVNNPPEPGVVYPADEDDQAKFYAKLDKRKAMADMRDDAGLNTNVYLYDEWDSGTGHYKKDGKRGMTHEEMMKFAGEVSDKHTAHQRKLMTSMANFVHRLLDEKVTALQMEARIQGDYYEDIDELYDNLDPVAPLDDMLSISCDVLNDSILEEIQKNIDDHEALNNSAPASLLVDDISDQKVLPWIKRFINRCVEDNMRYVIGPEYGSYISPDNMYNKLISTASWDDLFHLSRTEYSDKVIYHALRLRSKFIHITSAAHAVSLSYLNHIKWEVDKFRHSPLMWLKNNPFLAMIGIVAGAAGSVMLFKGLTLTLSLAFKYFSVNPTTEDEPVPYLQGKTEEDADPEMMHMKPILDSFFKIHIQAINEEDKLCYNSIPSTFVKLAGRTGRCPAHVFDAIECHFKRKGITKVTFGLVPLNSKMLVPRERFDVKDLYFDLRRKSEDIVYVTFPPTEPEFANIKCKFPADTPEFRALLSSREKVKGIIWVVRNGICVPKDVWFRTRDMFNYPVVTHLTCHKTERTVSTTPFMVSIKDCLIVDYPTIAGDCMMAAFLTDPIFHTLTKIDPALQNPVLFYSHTSGDNKLPIGYGNLMLRNEFDFIKSNQILPVWERVGKCYELRSSYFSKHTGRTQGNLTEYLVHVSREPEGFASHHEVKAELPGMYMSRNNPITRSEVYGSIKEAFGPYTKMPTNLNVRNGADPLVIARADYGGNVDITVNYRAALTVADSVVTDLFEASGPILYTHKYSSKQVIEGVPKEGIRPMDRSSSWGFEMKNLFAEYEISHDEYRYAFGSGEKFEYESRVSKIVLDIMADYDIRLELGEDMAAIYMDCLKAECKDSKKVRLFCACDKIFLLECKKYFGGFANWIYVNRIRNGIAIGINPYSEWKIFFQWLTEVGEYGIFGDYGKYDKRQIAMLMYVTKLAVRRYYAGCPESENTAREILFEKFIETLHVALEKGPTYLYAWFHGNTSGNLLTAIINSITGLFIVRYCAADILLEDEGGIDQVSVKQILSVMPVLKKRLRVAVYGDDNAIIVAEELRSKITFQKLSASITKHFNMEYTDEQKGKRIDYVIPPQTHIYHGSFIGRGFAFVRGVMVGFLRRVSIIEPLAWYKKTKDVEELVRNFGRANKELSAHGEEIFARDVPILSKICRDVLHRDPPFQSFDAAFLAFQSEDFFHFDPHFVYDVLCEDGILQEPEEVLLIPPQTTVDDMTELISVFEC
jgi:hypothetical protein